MAEKTVNFFQKTKKCPYGIICGGCAIFVFFATIGLIVGYAVSAGIAAQTSKVVSFVEEWWQKLLFSFDIIFALTGVSAFVFFVLKNVYVPYDGDDYIEIEVKERESRQAKYIRAEMFKIFPELVDSAPVRSDELANKLSDVENELISLRTQVALNTEYVTEQKQETERRRLAAQKRRENMRKNPHAVHVSAAKQIEDLRKELDELRAMLKKNSEVDDDNT